MQEHHLKDYIFSLNYMESLLKRETHITSLLILELLIYIRYLSSNFLTTLHYFFNENVVSKNVNAGLNYWTMCVPAARGWLRIQVHSTHAAPHLTTLPGGLRIEEEGAAGQGVLPQTLPNLLPPCEKSSTTVRADLHR